MYTCSLVTTTGAAAVGFVTCTGAWAWAGACGCELALADEDEDDHPKKSLYKLLKNPPNDDEELVDFGVEAAGATATATAGAAAAEATDPGA